MVVEYRRFALRRGSATAWLSENEILADGEEGYEKDTRRRKVGDGVTAWRDLPYDGPASGSSIDDNKVTPASVWSSTKTSNEIDSGLSDLKNEFEAIVAPSVPTIAWVNTEEEADALPPGTLAIILTPLGSVGTYLTTWSSLKTAIAKGEPVIIAHRGAGTNIAKDGALSTLDYGAAMPNGYSGLIIPDGGDGRLTSDGVLVVSHDDATGNLFNANITVSTSTLAQFKALRFKDFPLYRGTISTEAPPTMEEYLQKCKEMGLFTVPEIKQDESAQKIVDIVLATGMKDQCMIQAFASTPAQATLRLGKAKAAGIAVGLLQSGSANNIGFPAITTCINGGPPDLVLYDPASPTFTDAWLSAAIAAGITLQAGTFERRHIADEQKARVEGLGGKLGLVVSDDPFYTGRRLLPIDADRWDTVYAEHGILPSLETPAAALPRVIQNGTSGKLFFPASTAAGRYVLMGAFSDEVNFESLEFTATLDSANTNTQQWIGVFWGMSHDKNYHDGVTTVPGSLAMNVRMTGELNMYHRDMANVSNRVGTSLATVTTGIGPRSGAGNEPDWVVAGDHRIRLQRLRDAATGQFNDAWRLTDLTSGIWIESVAGVMPSYGGYFHIGTNAVLGGSYSIKDVVITRVPVEE